MRFDDAVVGGGPVGLMTAYHLARRGRKVGVLECSAKRHGSAVTANFGTIYPSGTELGEAHDLASASAPVWADLAGKLGVPLLRGSLLVADSDVAEQFAREYVKELGTHYDARLMTPSEVSRRSKLVRTDRVRCGIYSDRDFVVNSAELIMRLSEFLAKHHNVAFEYGRTVTRVETGELWAGEQKYSAERIWVCQGNKLILFPDQLWSAGIRNCSLQMMQISLDPSFSDEPIISGPLSLLHYPNGQGLSTFSALREELHQRYPLQIQHGVHVLFAIQPSTVSEPKLTARLGDDHEYDDEPNSLDLMPCPVREKRILAPTMDILRNGSFDIERRWIGRYPKDRVHGHSYVTHYPMERVVVMQAASGTSFTKAPEYARQTVELVLG